MPDRPAGRPLRRVTKYIIVDMYAKAITGHAGRGWPSSGPMGEASEDSIPERTPSSPSRVAFRARSIVRWPDATCALRPLDLKIFPEGRNAFRREGGRIMARIDRRMLLKLSGARSPCGWQAAGPRRPFLLPERAPAYAQG